MSTWARIDPYCRAGAAVRGLWMVRGLSGVVRMLRMGALAGLPSQVRALRDYLQVTSIVGTEGGLVFGLHDAD